MSLKTFFQKATETISDAWNNFLDWFGPAEAAVVQEGKTIIDELAPVVKADLFSEGSEALAIAGKGIIAGTDPLVLIAEVATSIWKAVVADGKDISKAASTTAGAFLVAKAKALQPASQDSAT